MSERNYKRSYLRAPHKFKVIHNSPAGTQFTNSICISEGALLLDDVKSFYEGRELNNLIIPLGQFPIFRDFDLDKLHNFSSESIPKKIIRAKGKVARKFQNKMAVEFTVLDDESKKSISEYVETFVKNSIYLLSLIDMAESDEDSYSRVKTMSRILGYDESDSIPALRAQVTHDYNSLQWL